MSNESKTNVSQQAAVDENKLITERRNKLIQLRENCKANGHRNDFDRKHLSAELNAKYGEFTKEELEGQNNQVAVAGRIMFQRGPFAKIHDVSGGIQFYVPKEIQKEINYKSKFDLGDIVGAKGTLHKSGKGELFVNIDHAEDLVMLTKALRPLPDKFHGLADQETKYRQRYVDLIINQETRDLFLVRSKIIEGIRQYLSERNFMEVETPMLQTIPGGATAKPFETHHNALDIGMYLRIAPELYLKRLLVGGFERVFEINRNFRNEGLSTRHNPEFTMIEFYQAYADYHDLMDTTEDMLRTLAKNILGTTDIKSTQKNADGDVISETIYDFAKPFTRLTMADAVLKYNPTFDAAVINNAEDNIEQMIAYARSVGIREDAQQSAWGAGKWLCEIFEATAEEKLDQPTFITAYPWEVSPLARRNDDNGFVTDRFEFFVGGRELANGFSELNDAEDQAARFRNQVEVKDAGDDEAMHYDADYIKALEYGMPPAAGEGIGIDRLVMLFTDSPTIKDVILFPHMKPLN
jgi:lysyl-tRNA synthetase class 2